jgi:hypothetical protein
MVISGVDPSWVGQRVRLELRGSLPGNSGFEERTGTVQDVNDLGVQLEEPVGSADNNLIRFYPWSAVRSMTLAP